MCFCTFTICENVFLGPFNAICILIIRDVVLVKRQTRKAIKAIKPIKKYRKIFNECELFKVYTLWQLVAYIRIAQQGFLSSVSCFRYIHYGSLYIYE